MKPRWSKVRRIIMYNLCWRKWIHYIQLINMLRYLLDLLVMSWVIIISCVVSLHVIFIIIIVWDLATIILVRSIVVVIITAHHITSMLHRYIHIIYHFLRRASTSHFRVTRHMIHFIDSRTFNFFVGRYILALDLSTNRRIMIVLFIN